MSAPIKGYETKNKSGNFQYATVERVSQDQLGTSMSAYMFMEIMAADAAEAASTTTLITATAHVAREGDKIRFTSGANSGYERRVSSVGTNDITVVEALPAAPGVGDTFQILRHRSPTVDQLGGVSTSIQFTRDGAPQAVVEDTVVPANNRPLPVKLTGFTGDVAINAANLNLEVQLSHLGANADSTRIGDGTNLLGVYAEDAVAAGGELGLYMLGQRNDAGTSPVSADGDYHGMQFDNSGNLRVTGGVTYAEDSAHVSGSSGNFVLAVRNDAASSLVNADGDYAPLQVDATGNLKVTGGVTYAEDSAHVSGDAGNFVLSVRNDAETSLVGTDGDYAPLQTNSTGRLKVSDAGSFAEDSAHASGDLGKFVLAVRNDVAGSLVGTDGDYAPLQVDSSGNLRVTGGQTYAEDSAHVSGDSGVMSLAVRNDAESSLVGTDGDYASLQVNSVGRLKVQDNTAHFAEDSAHVSADMGKFVLAVRNDASSSLVGTDGDYAPFQVDSLGRLKVAPNASDVYAEDSAHVSGDIGSFVLAVRNDAASSLVSASGDYSPLQVDSIGRLKVASSDLTVVDFLDTPFFDATTIAGSAGAFVTAVASTAAATKKVQVFDTSGAFIGVYTGAAAAETLAFVFGPGSNETVEISIPSGTRISFRSLETTAPTAGNITMNFIG